MTKHDRERAKVRWRERAWREWRELWHALICANRSSLGKQPGFVDSQKAPSAIYPSLSITCYYSSGALPLLHQWHLHNNYPRQSQSITEKYIDASMSHTLVDAATLSNQGTCAVLLCDKNWILIETYNTLELQCHKPSSTWKACTHKLVGSQARVKVKLILLFFEMLLKPCPREVL